MAIEIEAIIGAIGQTGIWDVSWIGPGNEINFNAV
jgi:hypothetical protein